MELVPITPRAARRAALRGAVLATPVGLVALAAGPRQALAAWLGFAAPIAAAALLEQSARPRRRVEVAGVAAVSGLAVLLGALLGLAQGMYAQGGLDVLMARELPGSLAAAGLAAAVPGLALAIVVAARLIEAGAPGRPPANGAGLMVAAAGWTALAPGALVLVLGLLRGAALEGLSVGATISFWTFIGGLVVLSLLGALLSAIDGLEGRCFPLDPQVDAPPA